MVNHSDLFLSQMSGINTLILNLIFSFLSLLHWKLNELSQCNFSTVALGQDTSAFLSELGIKEAFFDLHALPS